MKIRSMKKRSFWNPDIFIAIVLLAMSSALLADDVASTAAANPKSKFPLWVGYVNRNGVKGNGPGPEWWYVIKLENGTTETIRRGGSTSDGWQVVGASAQAGKPGSVTLQKGGAQKVLKLTPSDTNSAGQ